MRKSRAIPGLKNNAIIRNGEIFVLKGSIAVIRNLLDKYGTEDLKNKLSQMEHFLIASIEIKYNFERTRLINEYELIKNRTAYKSDKAKS